MSELDPRLAALGAAVARDLDRDAPARLAAQRTRFLATQPSPRRASPVLVAAAAVAAISVGGFFALRSPAPPEALRVTSGSGAALGAGSWLAHRGAPESLRFSDRSAVELEAGAQLRVGAISAAGAEVFVERGAVAVRVTHRPGARWRVHAGPWTVAVTGTAFRVAWSPADGRLDLAMREGSVILSGPSTPGRAIAGRERVVADGARGVIAFDDPASPMPVAAAARELRDASSGAIAEALPPSLPPAPRRPRRAAATTLSDAGTIAAQAHTTSPSEPSTVDTPASMLAEADRARLDGRASDARATLLALRERFPGTAEAVRGAYHLGVISLESLRAPAVAARWFEIALREAPDGPLATESLGRRVQCLDAAGDHDAARAAAGRYLAREPDGAFAPFARSVLTR